MLNKSGENAHPCLVLDLRGNAFGFSLLSMMLAISLSRTHAKLLQLCPTLCDPMDYISPGSSVCGILQARILEWVAMPSSRESPDPGMVSCLADGFFTTEPLGKPVGLSYMAFIMVKQVLSMPTFWRVFIINGQAVGWGQVSVPKR